MKSLKKPQTCKKSLKSLNRARKRSQDLKNLRFVFPTSTGWSSDELYTIWSLVLTGWALLLSLIEKGLNFLLTGRSTWSSLNNFLVPHLIFFNFFFFPPKELWSCVALSGIKRGREMNSTILFPFCPKDHGEKAFFLLRPQCIDLKEQ